LRIRTPGMIAGYLDATPAAGTGFRDGWFHPGDVGLVTKDRVLVLSGRVTEIINTGGLKISPRRIEDVLLAYPGISQAAAFGVEDDDGLPVIWAAIVTDKPLDGPAFNQFCQARLGGAAPRAILQMPDLPRNENGKVLVSRLAELARGRKAA
jgi:acyl-CoA synthetase (AMP-forming)/AMP-acid ligase II